MRTTLRHTRIRYAATLDWDRTPPGPPIPDEIVAATRDRYIDVYQRLTGEPWTD